MAVAEHKRMPALEDFDSAVEAEREEPVTGTCSVK